ncbi:MAG: hypothetical protein WCK47_09845 [bacterium]|nr:hypothetical protein [Candidatus Sumerlaeota bacterium]
MKACNWGALICASFLFTTTDIPAQETTMTTKRQHRPETETIWTTHPWGALGAARLEHAPFPDDTRTTGFSSKRGDFPREGHYDDNTVMIAIPRTFKPGRTPDFIAHFHGHMNEARRAVEHYKLGEQLNASGAGAILIVPQGPKNAPDSSGGKLEKPGMFAKFMDETITLLVKEGKLPKGARAGRIIVSGHSGAYRVLGMILDHGGMPQNIREAWLFDAAYGVLDELSAPFAPPTSAMRLRSIFTDHLSTENIQLMSNISRSGSRIMVVEDDDLTTRGTDVESLKGMKFPGFRGGAGVDELVESLRHERVLFIHTRLTHDGVIADRRYFEKFARCSPNLNTEQ